MTAAKETAVPKTEVARLKGSFSAAAKQRIETYLASFESFEPTLGLLYGDVAGQIAGRASWSITAFGPRTAFVRLKIIPTADAQAAFATTMSTERAANESDCWVGGECGDDR